MTGPPTVVFVHDAWHDGRAWDPVTLCLDARRRPWRTLTLPSTRPTVGPHRSPPGFAADVGAVIDVIEDIGDEVVLCGHGYGGLVVSEAGNHPAVVGLALLAAFCPEPGESLVDLARRALPANGFGWPALRVRRGWAELAPRWAPRLLFGDLPGSQRAGAVAGLRASSVPALSARVSARPGSGCPPSTGCAGGTAWWGWCGAGRWPSGWCGPR